MLRVTVAFSSGIERVVSKRSFVIGPGGDVDVAGDASARVVVRRRDLVAIIRPLGDAGWLSINGAAITAQTRLRPTDLVVLGSERFRIAVAGDAVESRWWDPRGWGEPDDDDAPVAPPRVPAPPRSQMIMRNPPAPVAPTFVPPRPIVHDVLSDEPHEQAFLEALRAAPDDEGTILVYADWLEASGRRDDADAVRGTARPGPGTLNYWRAIACDEAIRGCYEPACPGRWRKLVPILDDEMSRTCGTCMRRVYHGTPLL